MLHLVEREREKGRVESKEIVEDNNQVIRQINWERALSRHISSFSFTFPRPVSRIDTLSALIFSDLSMISGMQ